MYANFNIIRSLQRRAKVLKTEAFGFHKGTGIKESGSEDRKDAGSILITDRSEIDYNKSISGRIETRRVDIMAYLACPSCKFVWCVWKDGALIYHNKMIVQVKTMGMPCPLCFAECKIIIGEPPEICHHGFPKNIRCRECHKNDSDIRNHIEEIKRLSLGK